jgi:hypothetical protein
MSYQLAPLFKLQLTSVCYEIDSIKCLMTSLRDLHVDVWQQHSQLGSDT